MIVMAAIQQRQGEILKLEAEEIDAIRERLASEAEEIAAIRERLALQAQELQQERATRQERMAEWDARIDKLVSGFGAFLRERNG